jgi:hypothetical protein
VSKHSRSITDIMDELIAVLKPAPGRPPAKGIAWASTDEGQSEKYRAGWSDGWDACAESIRDILERK